MCIGLPALRAPGASVPDGRTICYDLRESQQNIGTKHLIPVTTNPIESVFATVRHRTVRTKMFVVADHCQAAGVQAGRGGIKDLATT